MVFQRIRTVHKTRTRKLKRIGNFSFSFVFFRRQISDISFRTHQQNKREHSSVLISWPVYPAETGGGGGKREFQSICTHTHTHVCDRNSTTMSSLGAFPLACNPHHSLSLSCLFLPFSFTAAPSCVLSPILSLSWSSPASSFD